MFKQKQDLIIIVVTLIELLLSCYQVFCNGIYFILIVFKYNLIFNLLNQIIDLIISNMAPKLNETITITALNVPNFTSINIDRAIGYGNI
jgi:hypothetical protein